MFSGLPGGSPGPNAEGTLYGLLMIFLFSAVIGAAFLYLWSEITKLGIPGF